MPRKIPGDVKWCKDNIQTLTAKAFFDEYNFTDRRKACRRYNTILQRYLIDNEKFQQLTREFKAFKSSSYYKNYWKEKRRNIVRDRIHEICADYVGDVAEQEANELRNGDEELSTQTQARIGEIIPDAAASEVNLNDEQARTFLSDEPAKESTQEPTHHEHVQQEPLNDIQDCFRIFKNEVKRIIQGNQTLKMEEHVQELLALNNILLLQPLQHSHLMRSVFTDSLLAKVHDEFQKKIEFPDMKFTPTEFMSIVENIMNLDSGITSVLSTTTGLLQIASKMPYEKQRVIVGLAML
ncbi:hypothetical protein BD770DRAFT_396877 [Pilaira anomala]|nr:hypothetical protein BD770DRAFT_396877 [Pilaira anomala]